MKNILGILALALSLLCTPAEAGIQSIGYAGLKITAPDTIASVAAIPGVCDPMSVLIDFNNPSAPISYYMANCATTPTFSQFYPPVASNISGINNYLLSSTASTIYFPIPSGTSAQYLDGTGAPQTFPTAASRTFQYPSRALNSCYQISNTQDADFHYGIDITAALNLSGGQTGSAAVVSYTNSGCTTGAQQLTPTKQNGNTGTLTIGLGLSQIISVGLDGTAPKGKWVKIITANVTGTPTFAINSNQAETLLP